MASKIKKKVKYNKNIHPQQYFDLCLKGYTLDMIAAEMETVVDELIKWSKDKIKYEWQAVWQRGKEAAKAYHERTLLEMASDPNQKAVKDRMAITKDLLKTSMGKNWEKGDWDKEKDTVINVNHMESLRSDQLIDQISSKIKRISAIQPDIIGKVVNFKDGTQKD